MNYNADVITHLAKQMAETFKPPGLVGNQPKALADDCQSRTEPAGNVAPDWSRGLEPVLEYGTGNAGGGTAVRLWGTLQYQRQRPATVTSVFGKITYERAYYAGCACGRGQAPVDERYGLEPGTMTSGLAALLGLAGVEFGFDESWAWLQAFLLFDVAGNTVRSETQTFGALQAQREEALCQPSQEADYLQARPWETPRRPARLYGSLDGDKGRIEPRAKAGKKPEKTHTPMPCRSWIGISPPTA